MFRAKKFEKKVKIVTVNRIKDVAALWINFRALVLDGNDSKRCDDRRVKKCGR